ncbi:MAG: hypothetical protein M3Q79_03910 [bacterium]|nr:hypothetical protein [bacterium]
MNGETLTTQDKLFEAVRQPEIVKKYREFLATELIEDLSYEVDTLPDGICDIEEDEDFETVFMALSIAVGGIAEELAAIDTDLTVAGDDPRLCSEIIPSRINPKGDLKSTDPFSFDVDRGSEFASGAGLSFDQFVDALGQRAQSMALVLLDEIRYRIQDSLEG